MKEIISGKLYDTEWCLAVYEATINAKRGIVVVSKSERRGLWYYAAYPPLTSAQHGD